MLPKNSTTVTSAPNRLQTLPISSPITPPPMTTIFPGTCCKSSAPVELTICCSSISIPPPGKGVTSEPVAMMMFFASISVSPPSLSWTDRRVGGDKRCSALDVVDLVLAEEGLNTLGQTRDGILLRLEHLRKVEGDAGHCALCERVLYIILVDAPSIPRRLRSCCV